jgi:hypothetical protein
MRGIIFKIFLSKFWHYCSHDYIIITKEHIIDIYIYYTERFIFGIVQNIILF